MGINRKRFDLINSNIELHQRYNPRHNFILLYIGRLSDKKGVEYLILAMKTIIKYCDKIQLFIGGDGPNRDSLINEVQNLNLHNNITFFRLY